MQAEIARKLRELEKLQTVQQRLQQAQPDAKVRPPIVHPPGALPFCEICESRVPERKNGIKQHVPCTLAHGVTIDPPGWCCLTCAVNGGPSAAKLKRRAAAVAGLAAGSPRGRVVRRIGY